MIRPSLHQFLSSWQNLLKTGQSDLIIVISFLSSVFTALFVYYRSQRLQFDVSSPNGILLIRVISKVILAYGV